MIFFANKFDTFCRNENFMMRRPLIPLCLSLIAGTLAGSYWTIPLYIFPVLAVLLLILTFFTLRHQWILTCFLLFIGFVFLLGFFNIQKQIHFTERNHDIQNFADQDTMAVEGVIVESPVSYIDKDVLIVRCLRVVTDKSYVPATGYVRLAVPTRLNLRYGDFIRFHSSLRVIHNFNNPGAFDYKRFMNLQGIYVSGFINDPSKIILLRKHSSGNIKNTIESFRIYLKKIISENSASPQKSIIEAMTLGNQNEIPAEIRDNFSKTGTSHILSISGLHVGMVAASFFFLIFLLLKSSEYLMLKFNIVKIAAASAFGMVLIYATIAGMGVTVLRATLMAFIFLIALLIGRRKDFYNTLAVAGLLILLISPEALFDISFQLSFISVLAIIYIVPRFGNLLPGKISSLPSGLQSLIRYAYMTVVVSLAATLGTLPLIVFYFDRVSLVTILANLIAVPLLGTLTLALAMFFILSAFFSPVIAGYFVQLASFTTRISVDIINHLAGFSWSSLSLSKPSLMEIVLFYLLIFFAVQWMDDVRKKRNDLHFSSRRFAFINYALILIVVIIGANAAYLTLRDRLSHDLTVTVIDVGQGNSTLVRFPRGENMLIDGGGFSKGSFDVGKGVVAPFLYHQRINHIGTAVLSHPHPDHLLGLIYILNHFNVHEIWQTPLPVNPEIYPEWESAITANHIKTRLLNNTAGEKNINGVRIKILWPPDNLHQSGDKLSHDEENDSSMVMKITYGSVSFLFPGDISSDVENFLVRSGADLKSDVLIIPHHGSKHSSSAEFIRAVGCRYAVVSAGKSNVFRHPHPSVLQRYRQAGVYIFRTDCDGAVTFKTDGHYLRTETFVRKALNIPPIQQTR